MDLVQYVLGDQRHFVDHFLLKMKSREGALKPFIQPFEFIVQFRALGVFQGCLAFGKSIIHLLIQHSDFLNQKPQAFEMPVPAVDQFVYHDAVKALFGRHRNELLCQGHMFFACETKTINNSPRFIFGFFDSLANLHLLFAGK